MKQTPRAPDPRPARTRATILRAVETLIATDLTVSISAVVETAGITRSTFYLQFSDIDDLALTVLTNEFRAIGIYDIAQRREAFSDERQIARAAANKLVEHIDRRRQFYRSSLEWRVTSRVRDTLAAAFADQISASIAVMGDRVPPAHRDGFTARYIGGGAMALITAWMQDDEPLPAPEMATRLLAAMPEWLVGSGQSALQIFQPRT